MAISITGLILDIQGDNAEEYYHRPKFIVASEAKQNDNERW